MAMGQATGLVRIGVDVSGITTDTVAAFYYLRDLQAFGKPDGMDGYRPFTLSDYEPGVIRLACLPRDTHAVEKFVTGYLSKKIGDLKKRLEEISRN